MVLNKGIINKGSIKKHEWKKVLLKVIGRFKRAKFWTNLKTKVIFIKIYPKKNIT